MIDLLQTMLLQFVVRFAVDSAVDFDLDAVDLNAVDPMQF